MPDQAYRNPHPFHSPEWYAATFQCLEGCHKNVFGKIKNLCWDSIDTVLEIGCGTYDFYPIAFAEKKYTGCDIDPAVIAYCQEHYAAKFPHHQWKIRTEHAFPDESYDLVLANSVIDHAEDPDQFIDDCIRVANRFIFIVSYRGYFLELPDHKQQKGEDGFFYNDISSQRVIGELEKRSDIFGFDVLPLATGRPPVEIQYETVVKIEKNA